MAARKQMVVQALAEAIKREAGNPIFWTQALRLLYDELDRKSIVYDFDPATLLLEGIAHYVAAGASAPVGLPAIGQSLYVVDEQSGDGGVEWITGSANPVIRDELARGVYFDQSLSVPKDNADPYAPDLIAHYWPSVRRLVRQRLTSPSPQ
ncbi:MAG: hypothetical protein HY259_05840 [Chloroflexi bacterium]|nr:hypothetical protein [Chloroflexota bacterium]